MTSPVNKPFHCSDCGKEFSKEKKLLSHFKVHSTGKSYRCEVCKMTFSQKALYKKHIKTHFDKGNCSCPKCGKVFMRHSWFKRHMNLKCDESNQSDNKFACRDCGKMYDSMAGVKSHLRKGKHVFPVFMCYACKCICSSSKNLFLHVLQHSNVNIIVVGLDQEQHLECFSTSKVREKVDAFKQRTQDMQEAVRLTKGEMEPHSIIEIDVAKPSPWEENTDEVQLTNSLPSKNSLDSKMADNEATQEESLDQDQLPTGTECDGEEQEDTIVSNSTIEENGMTNSNNEENSCLASPVEPASSVLSSNDNTNDEIAVANARNTENYTSVLPIESLNAVLQPNGKTLNENGNQNQTANEDETADCAMQSASGNLHQDDIVLKKMPKLVSLYPEEEAVEIQNMCTLSNSNMMLQNGITLPPHNIICSGLPVETTTNRHNEMIMPYPTPVVNTMFLPPLFLVQNSMPINNDVRLQSSFPLGDTLTDNQSMVDKAPGLTVIDELKSMTSDVSLPRKKRKRQTRFGKKYAEIVRQMQQDTSANILAQNYQMNQNQQSVKEDCTVNINSSNPLPHSFNLSSSDEPVSSQISNISLPQEKGPNEGNALATNEQIIASDSNWFMGDFNDQCSQDSQSSQLIENHFWDTLIGNEDCSKISKQFPEVYLKSPSKVTDRVQRCDKTLEFQKNGTKSHNDNHEGKHKRNNNITNTTHQKPNPKEGIGVEDYIKKFMWL